MIMIEKKQHYNKLLQFYINLLTDKQADIMTLYYKEDYSLSEIAVLKNTTRNAIYDMIYRSQKMLDYYEVKLKLVSNYDKRVIIYGKLLEVNDLKVIELVKECIDIEEGEML